MLETVNLSCPQCPLRIEYSKAAMEQIRQRARAGLMAAPRVGIAVGGLLLGVKTDSRIRILDSVEIPCSHSGGPSFNLTPQEKRETTEMVAEANALSAASKVTVVGWYCSRTRGDAVLSDSDRSLFDDLFPGEGQLALVLRPDVFEAMRAAFFYRDQTGAVMKGPECEVDEWRAAPLSEVEPESAISSAPAPPPPAPPLPTKTAPPPESPKVVEIRPLVVPQLVKPPEPEPAAPPPVKPLSIPVTETSLPAAATSLKDIIGLSADEPPARTHSAPAYLNPSLGVPSFGMKPQTTDRSRILLFAVVAVILVSVLAFFTRDIWYPRPPLVLTFSQLHGSLLIHWDPDSLRDVRHASMYVNDGGQNLPLVIDLDRLQIVSGQFSLTPKSNHVTAKLDAGATSAFNTWVAPEGPEDKGNPGAPSADAKPDDAPASTDPPAAQ